MFGFGGEYPRECGLPLYLVQGYRAVSKTIEDVLLSGPYPKLCVARWLVEICRELGVPDTQAVHMPVGLDHSKYRAITRIKNRPAQVAMAYNSHPLKRAQLGLDALARVKRRLAGGGGHRIRGHRSNPRDSRRSHIPDVAVAGDDRRADLQPQPRFRQLERRRGLQSAEYRGDGLWLRPRDDGQRWFARLRFSRRNRPRSLTGERGEPRDVRRAAAQR